MKKMNKKEVLKIFCILDLILAVYLIFIFLPFGKTGSIREKNSYLLKVKSSDVIKEIVMTDASSGKELALMNRSGLWMGTDSLETDTVLWPCNQEFIQNLINKSINSISMSKISDTYRGKSAFLLDNSQCKTLSFYNGGGQLLKTVSFGSVDPITGQIAVRFDSSDEVYSLKDDWSPFLNCSSSWWCDPYIFPRSVTGYRESDCTGLLRRGQVVSFEEGIPDEVLRFDFGNGRSIVYSVYNNENKYILHGTCIPGPADSNDIKKILASQNYYFSISQWTFEKLKELK